MTVAIMAAPILLIADGLSQMESGSPDGGVIILHIKELVTAKNINNLVEITLDNNKAPIYIKDC